MTCSIASAEEPAEPDVVRVVLRRHGSGVPWAGTVQVDGRALAAGPDGRLTLPLPPGRHVLTFVEEGVAVDVAEVEVTGRARRLVVFVRGLDVVEVVAAPAEGPARTSTTQEELRETAGAFGDPVRATETHPAVATLQVGDPGLTVRGSEPTHTAVRVDGIDVPWLFHWYILRSTVNPAALDRLDFFPTGLPASQGGFAQGLLVADLEDTAAHRGVHGRVTFDLLDGSLALKGRVGDWHLSASGRTSWGGDLAQLPFLIASAGAREPPSRMNIRWSDYHARAHGQLGRHTLTLTALGAVDLMTRLPGATYVVAESEEEKPPSLRQRRRAPSPVEVTPEEYAYLQRLPYDPDRPIARNYHRADLTWTTTWARGDQRTSATFGYERDATSLHKAGLPFDLGPTMFDLPLMAELVSWRGVVRHGQHHRVAPRWTVGAGVDGDLQVADAEDWLDLDPVTAEAPGDRQLLATISPWALAVHDTGHTWLSVGGRAAVHRQSGRWWVRPEPRILLRQRVHPHATLTGFLGGTSQRPPAWQTSRSLGNPDMPPIQSWQAALGAELRWDELEVDVTGYGTWLPEVTLLRATPRVVRLADTGKDHVILDNGYEVAQGIATGLELQARWRPGGQGLLGAAVSVGRALRFDGEETWLAARDRPFASTLWGAWHPGRRWALSGRFQAAAGYPATPQVAIPDVHSLAPVVLTPPRTTRRNPWHVQLDVRVAKTWVAKRAEWTLYLDVFNVTSARVPVATRFSPLEDRHRVALWLPIVPNLGLDVAF